MKTQPPIQLSTEEKQALTPLLQDYLASELDQDISRFEAEFLLDFILAQIGPVVYNRALQDAQTYVKGRLTEIEHGLFELEKVIPNRR